MKRYAFTMIELVFVIVIMGIIGKFGVEMLANSYQNFLQTSTQNRLEAQSEAVITQIAARLQYRIKDTLNDRNSSRLRWIGYDIDGWRGTWNATDNMNTPNWSGFIDLIPDKDKLKSPKTSTSLIGSTIETLSYETKDINDTALFFIGQEGDINGSGWGTGSITDQSEFAHPINSSGTDTFAPKVGDFSGVDVFEFYQLSWSAYEIYFNSDENLSDGSKGTLTLYYNYQPWNGDTIANAKHSILMTNVQDFNFQTIGNLIKIQVCVRDRNISSSEGYGVCKEKTIF